MKNIIRCNRCGSYLSAEFFKSHICVNFREIPSTFQYEIVKDKNESVIMAKGWDDVLYRFVKTNVKSKIRAYPCAYLKGIAEIPIICYSKMEPNTFEAKGWDGTIYRIFESKLKPLTLFSSDDFLQGVSNRRRLYRTWLFVPQMHQFY